MIHQVLLISVFIVFGVARAKLPAIIVFGDSTVDAGNNNYIGTLVKSNFRPYGRDFEGGEPTGRFCNGMLVTDFLSRGFGIKPYIPAYLDPAYGIQEFSTGVSFASGGTGWDNLTATEMSVIPLWQQLEYFKDLKSRLLGFMGNINAEKTLGDAMYLISVGTNDFIENYYINPFGRRAEFSVAEYANYLVSVAENFISDLYQLGARNIVLTGFPPMGCLPLVRSLNIVGRGACRADYNNVAIDVDERLRALVAKLNKELPHIKLLFNDVLNPTLQVINNPLAYGIEKVALGCCGTGRYEWSYTCNENNPFTCKDANKYVFWDAVHPTQKLNEIVADHLLRTTLAQYM